MTARSMTERLGGNWCGSYGLVPAPGHSKRDRSVKVWDAPDGTTRVHCFSPRETWQDVRRQWERDGLLPRLSDHADTFRRRRRKENVAPARQSGDDRRAEVARRIWRSCGPADDTHTQSYLRSRGITGPIPPSIRHCVSLNHPSVNLAFPAMVAAVQRAAGRVVAVHRTFLLPAGRGKARVSSPRLALGPIAGGAVRLAATEDALCLVEGIEDGLSLQQMAGAPCWAVLGTAGFLNIDLPPHIRRVVLAPDGDEAGAAIIERAGNRLADRGLTVEIARPPAGMDWNDLLIECEERAGIAEHDGGLPRAEAEALARLEAIGGRR